MLSETQTRLEAHFAGLSRERLSLGFPVYAFEHGLEAEEVDGIRRSLCSELARSESLESTHWLLWIVVAAEIGYTYDGDEYWRSFASEIPNWMRFGNRDAVREWFKKFKTQFSGFSPSGRWADHFSIIAWPITHSILPSYIQSQFARHLHDLRFDLAAQSEVAVEPLGKLLAERYDGGSSRFENFLQQTPLTARLVLALRDEDVHGTVPPIHRPTLARIVKDLESKATSRRYLRDARRILRDARVQAELGMGGSTLRRPGASQAASIQSAPGGLNLIGRESVDGSWTLGVAFPDFASVLQHAKLGAAVLNKVRMRFADKPAGWMPGRALLAYSGRDQPLMALPSPLTNPVIVFENAGGTLGGLADELRILTRSPWLLRIQDDGVARQVLGNHVRTGESYMVAAVATILPDVAKALELQMVDSRTSGINLYRMEVPPVATPRFVQGLEALTLGYALRAHVRPVGLVPRWDASLGSSVWLSTEEILLQLSADFEVTEFSVSMNGQPRTRFPVTNRNALIVSLGTPPIGRYSVEVTAIAPNQLVGAKTGLPTMSVMPETVFIEVRPPAPWQQAIAKQAGFRVVLDPANASYNDFLAKRATLSIHGPPERVAAAEVRLFDGNGHLSGTHKIGTFSLPASAGSLARLTNQLSQEPLSEIIQSSPRIELAFVVDELGVGAVSFARKVLPLRWKLETRGHERIARLVDEAGVGTSISVERFDIETPDCRIELDPEQCLSGVLASAPGSLFVARHGDRRYAAVASSPPQMHLKSFTELDIIVKITTPEDSPRRIMRLLAFYRCWRASRALGPLALVRKAKVLQAFEYHIARQACGPKWVDQTRAFHPGTPASIDQVQRDVGGSPGFASRMKTTDWSWFPDSHAARASFFNYAKTYKISDDPKLSELALRLAFDPSSIRFDDPKTGSELFERLAGAPILARGAYFAKLMADLKDENGDAPGMGGQL